MNECALPATSMALNSSPVMVTVTSTALLRHYEALGISRLGWRKENEYVTKLPRRRFEIARLIWRVGVLLVWLR